MARLRRSRRESRRLAVQALYAYGFDQQPVDRLLAGLRDVLTEDEAPPSPDPAEAFAIELCRAACEHLDRIDAELAAVVEHWRPERLSLTDRAILRLATGEILFFADIPPRVTLDEYIELAKELGDDQSSQFVNGVLDRILRRNPKPDRGAGRGRRPVRGRAMGEGGKLQRNEKSV